MRPEAGMVDGHRIHREQHSAVKSDHVSDLLEWNDAPQSFSTGLFATKFSQPLECNVTGFLKD